MADLADGRPAASPTGRSPTGPPRPPAEPPAIRGSPRRPTGSAARGSRPSASSARRTRTSTTSSSGRTWPEFFLLVAVVFVLTNMLFAWLFLAEPGAVANVRPGSFEDAFYFSVQTLATIGYGGMYPASRYGHAVVALEAIVGILMVALITGITFTRFARPIGPRAVLGQGRHLAARRRPARDVPDGQLAPQPDRRGAPGRGRAGDRADARGGHDAAADRSAARARPDQRLLPDLERDAPRRRDRARSSGPTRSTGCARSRPRSTWR